MCGDFWPGDTLFSVPETKDMKDFVAKNKNELKFMIKYHTSGNEFIWPFDEEIQMISSQELQNISLFFKILFKTHVYLINKLKETHMK